MPWCFASIRAGACSFLKCCDGNASALPCGFFSSQRVSLGTLTSHEFGAGLTAAEKPEFGRLSTTKEFYDIGHVGIN